VLLDVKLPDIGGLDVFEEIKRLAPDLPVIFVTGHAALDLAVEATRRGGFDFIAKGSDLTKRLNVAVKNAFDRLAMTEQLNSLRTQLSDQGHFSEFLTVSPRMKQILRTLESVVNSGVTVLIEGESGTGKEVISRAIHAAGNRKNGPFIAVNCAGIPEPLLESEMFGYEKGAFTGANSRRAGKFEAAHGGTLFLDEVGELPKALQAKLLRVLQDHTFQRVGGTETISVDVRVVSATNRDLRTEAQEGNFREDLFYRLSVFPVRLLPLRERPEDVPMLAQHFLRRFVREEGKSLVGFSQSALRMLSSHPFPGNVRELENLVRHAVIVAHGSEISAEDVKFTLGSHRSSFSRPDPAGAVLPKVDPASPLEQRLQAMFPDIDSLLPMQEVQAAYLQLAIDVSEGNVSKAARALGVGRATLYRRLKDDAPPDDGGL
jgi:DNA-binding NtrC family response regulator